MKLRETLPSCASAPAPGPRSAADAEGPTSGGSAGESEPQSPFLVLVVDDDEINRLTVSAALREQGYGVATASNGVEALGRVDQGGVDLVLLDLVMPVMGGFDTLGALRRHYAAEVLPVIIATSRDASEDVVRAFRSGANDYVTKPCDAAVLAVRVEAQLRGRRRRRVGREGDQDVLIEPGAVLGGKYELEGLIGQGAYGAVYRARHRELETVVAVKVLREDRLDPSFHQERFRREGIAASRVLHPNAVQVRDFGLTSRGSPYLVMEYLEGRSLADELERCGRLRPRRSLEVLEPVCDVLAEAHRLGTVHRDVKPSNVFLHQTRRGEVVKVLDFGLAADFQTAPGEAGSPAGDDTAGTPAYIAPERLLGQPYDGSSDVYSLGVVLYEALVGRLPFASRPHNVAGMFWAHIQEPPPPLRQLCPELSSEIETVVLAALDKVPASRPAAGELARSFRAAVERLDGAASATPER